MSGRRRRARSGFGLARRIGAILVAVGCLGDDVTAGDEPTTVLLVVGAAGDASYGDLFAQSAERWTRVCAEAEAICHRIGGEAEDPAEDDLEQLRLALEQAVRDTRAPLWLVLLGHGTFDGETARFNLRGPDLSASQLAAWLEPLRRPVIVINTSSSSAPFLPALKGPNRIVITATRSGFEQNFARFGQFLAQTITDDEADLDQDGQISLLEGFLMASRRTADFYEGEGRLVTEHALLDDNGDGQGTPADWFRGVRVVKQAAGQTLPDGVRAHQIHLIPSTRESHWTMEEREKRDQLEADIVRLRGKKAQMDESVYYGQLEFLFVELARLYEQVEGSEPSDPDADP